MVSTIEATPTVHWSTIECQRYCTNVLYRTLRKDWDYEACRGVAIDEGYMQGMLTKLNDLFNSHMRGPGRGGGEGGRSRYSICIVYIYLTFSPGFPRQDVLIHFHFFFFSSFLLDANY